MTSPTPRTPHEGHRTATATELQPSDRAVLRTSRFEFTQVHRGAQQPIGGVLVISHGKVRSADYYLAEDINHAGYYLDRTESLGRWQGGLAASLGLHGPVDETAFRAMLDGRHPITGDPFADTQQHRTAPGQRRAITTRRYPLWHLMSW